MAKNPLQLGTYHMAQSNDFEPQRTNNFEVQITGLEKLTTVDKGLAIASNAGDLITLSTDSFSAPQVSVGTVDISYGNNKIHFAGVPEFSGGSLTLNDYIGINIERILTAWFKLVYNMKTKAVGIATDYKKVAYMIEYAPDGTQARQWQLIGCFPTSIQLGDYSQDGANVRKITMELSYDYCVPLDD